MTAELAARPVARDPWLTVPAALAELVGADADISYKLPADLGPCELACTDRPAVAAVSWADDRQSCGRESLRACRSCLPAACEQARDHATDGERVQVDVPAWKAVDVPDATGVTYRQLDFWVSKSYLHCEGDGHPGSGYERGRFLADEVAAATVMAQLVALDVKPRGARRLFDASPALARQVVETGRGGVDGGVPGPPVGDDGQVFTSIREHCELSADPSCSWCGGDGHPDGPCAHCQT